MYKRIIYLFIFALLSMATKCEDDFLGDLYLVNNSNEKIYFRDLVSNDKL